jgi:kumamolisin
MPSPTKRVPVPGSERAAVPDAQVIGAPDPNQRIEVTLVLRRRPSSEQLPPPEELGSRLPHERQYLTREELASRHGADPNDVAQVTEFAQEHNLKVEEVSLPRRTVKVSGTVADLNRAFGVTMEHYRHGESVYRSRVGSVYVPSNLEEIVKGVLGLTNRPVAKPHSRRRDSGEGRIQARAQNVSYTPLQIAKMYDFPAGLDGKGQCIGILELNTAKNAAQPRATLGAGYSETDLKAYFASLGVPEPKVVPVSVDGGQNLPGVNLDADGEVTLDIEVAGAIAPGATIAVYFAPNTDQGFLNALTTAVHDTVNNPSVISISWGGPEAEPAQTLHTFDAALQDAAALGVTVCVASGDDGSSDGVNDKRAHVDFPASSPYALACGGTRLEGSGATITNESVWNDGPAGGAGGGGVSDFFPVPKWQAKAKVPPSHNPGKHTGRGVPDVAGDADPQTGYQILLDSKPVVMGGTSAVAPLWAGLLALINQHLGRNVGYLNPLLYGNASVAAAFHDITRGNNDLNGDLGAYAAGSGWDACTGLGTPNGTALMRALTGAAAAPVSAR